MDVKQVKINEIKAYKKNAKKHPEEQVKAIANSIKEFGFRQPLVLDKNMEIIVGHGRLAAAKLLGMTAVPVVMADDLTDEQVKAFRLADNKTNESEWDFDLLEEELNDILTIDMSDFGFEIDDLNIEDTEIKEDEVPHEVETRCKMGDIWQLGNHRLICGDSTDPAVIDRLMDGVKAKLLLTDPPYGIDVVKGNKVGGDKAFGKVGGGGQTRFGKVGGGKYCKEQNLFCHNWR